MNELMTLNDSQSLSDVIQSGSEQDLQKLLGSEPTGPQSSLSRLYINYNTEDENDAKTLAMIEVKQNLHDYITGYADLEDEEEDENK